MQKSKMFLWSVINSLATFAYILGVAWMMFNGEKLFGQDGKSFLMPAALLLLFVISATIAGALVLGRPIYLYLNGQKSEAVKMLVYTIVCLFIIAVIVFLRIAVIK